MEPVKVQCFGSGMLENTIWNFSANGRLLSTALELRNDGSLFGYYHPNEAFWEFTEKGIRFLNSQRVPTGMLDRFVTEDGRIEYVGPSLRNSSVTFKLVMTTWENRELYNQETRQLLKSDLDKHGWDIGAHTYGRPRIHERLAKLTIGKFCSIASGVEIALGNHRIDAVSSYPFMTLNRYWPSAGGARDHATRGDVVIGSDVWIAASAFIGSGVTVGHGAVIGAHAVVSRDVPPYAIVAGNPARVVRYRFENAVVDELLNIAWWDWSDSKVNEFLPLMYGSTISEFIQAANRSR